MIVRYLKLSQVTLFLGGHEQRVNLGLVEPSVTTERTNRREFADLGPSSDGLRVYPEDRRNLARRQELFRLLDRFCHHYSPRFVSALRGLHNY